LRKEGLAPIRPPLHRNEHYVRAVDEVLAPLTRFVAVTQGLDTDIQNPASRFLLHVLGAAAELERSLIRERTQAGRLRYKQDFDAGRVGKTVFSKSRKNLPICRPKRIFNRERVIELRHRGASIRAIAKPLGVGVGTVTRTLRERSRIS
jgi:putative DNA-invertase from lambdoid prophage Rac